MNNSPIIADSGVLVALIYEKDQCHKWTLEQTEQLAPPFYTCEAVITEICYLLQNVKNGEQNILGMIADGNLQIDFLLSAEVENIQSLMKKYSNLPMSLADACLVRMSELIDNSIVFTTDSDFHIYRKNGKEKISIIIPE